MDSLQSPNGECTFEAAKVQASESVAAATNGSIMPTTMKEAHVHEDSSVTLHDVPVPAIDDPSQLLVKVVCTSSNPKV